MQGVLKPKTEISLQKSLSQTGAVKVLKEVKNGIREIKNFGHQWSGLTGNYDQVGTPEQVAKIVCTTVIHENDIEKLLPITEPFSGPGAFAHQLAAMRVAHQVQRKDKVIHLIDTDSAVFGAPRGVKLPQDKLKDIYHHDHRVQAHLVDVLDYTGEKPKVCIANPPFCTNAALMCNLLRKLFISWSLEKLYCIVPSSHLSTMASSFIMETKWFMKMPTVLNRISNVCLVAITNVLGDSVYVDEDRIDPFGYALPTGFMSTHYEMALKDELLGARPSCWLEFVRRLPPAERRDFAAYGVCSTLTSAVALQIDSVHSGRHDYTKTIKTIIKKYAALSNIRLSSDYFFHSVHFNSTIMRKLLTTLSGTPNLQFVNIALGKYDSHWDESPWFDFIENYYSGSVLMDSATDTQSTDSDTSQDGDDVTHDVDVDDDEFDQFELNVEEKEQLSHVRSAISSLLGMYGDVEDIHHVITKETAIAESNSEDYLYCGEQGYIFRHAKRKSKYGTNFAWLYNGKPVVRAKYHAALCMVYETFCQMNNCAFYDWKIAIVELLKMGRQVAKLTQAQSCSPQIMLLATEHQDYNTFRIKHATDLEKDSLLHHIINCKSVPARVKTDIEQFYVSDIVMQHARNVTDDGCSCVREFVDFSRYHNFSTDLNAIHVWSQNRGSPIPALLTLMMTPERHAPRTLLEIALRLKGAIGEIAAACCVFPGAQLQPEHLRPATGPLNRKADFLYNDQAVEVTWSNNPEYQHRSCVSNEVPLCVHFTNNRTTRFGCDKLCPECFDVMKRMSRIVSIVVKDIPSGPDKRAEFMKHYQTGQKFKPKPQKQKLVQDFSERMAKRTQVHEPAAMKDLIGRTGAFEYMNHPEVGTEYIKKFTEAVKQPLLTDSRLFTSNMKDIVDKMEQEFKKGDIDCRHHRATNLMVPQFKEKESENIRIRSPFARIFTHTKTFKSQCRSTCRNLSLLWATKHNLKLVTLDEGRVLWPEKASINLSKHNNSELWERELKLLQKHLPHENGDCEICDDARTWSYDAFINPEHHLFHPPTKQQRQMSIVTRDLILAHSPMSILSEDQRKERIASYRIAKKPTSVIKPCDSCNIGIEHLLDELTETTQRHKMVKEHFEKTESCMEHLKGHDKYAYQCRRKIREQISETKAYAAAVLWMKICESFLVAVRAPKLATIAHLIPVQDTPFSLLIITGRNLDERAIQCRLISPIQFKTLTCAPVCLPSESTPFYHSEEFSLSIRQATSGMGLPCAAIAAGELCHEKENVKHSEAYCSDCIISKGVKKYVAFATILGCRHKKTDTVTLSAQRYATIIFTGEFVHQSLPRKLIPQVFEPFSKWLQMRIINSSKHLIQVDRTQLIKGDSALPSCFINDLIWDNPCHLVMEHYLMHIVHPDIPHWDHSMIACSDKAFKASFAQETLLKAAKAKYDDGTDPYHWFAMRGYTDNPENVDEQIQLSLYIMNSNQDFFMQCKMHVWASSQLLRQRFKEFKLPEDLSRNIERLSNSHSVILDPCRSFTVKTLQKKRLNQQERRQELVIKGCQKIDPEKIAQVKDGSLAWNDFFDVRKPFDFNAIVIEDTDTAKCLLFHFLRQERRKYDTTIELQDQLSTTDTPEWAQKCLKIIWEEDPNVCRVSKALIRFVPQMSFKLIPQQVWNAIKDTNKSRDQLFNRRLQLTRRTKNVLHMPHTIMGQDVEPFESYTCGDAAISAIYSTDWPFYGFAPKAQRGGPRELPIQEVHTKIANDFSERMSQKLLEDIPEDILTSAKTKHELFNRFTQSGWLFGSEDHSGWGTKHCPDNFASVISAFIDLEPDVMLPWYHWCLKMSNKDLEIPSIVVDRIISTDFQDSEPHREFIKSKVMSGQACFQSFANMGQGMMHHCSSLVGASSCAMTKRCFGVDRRQGSDDAMSIWPAKDIEQLEKSARMSKIYGMNLSPKSAYSYVIKELNSEFDFKNRKMPVPEKFIFNMTISGPKETWADTVVSQYNMALQSLQNGVSYTIWVRLLAATLQIYQPKEQLRGKTWVTGGMPSLSRSTVMGCNLLGQLLQTDEGKNLLRNLIGRHYAEDAQSSRERETLGIPLPRTIMPAVDDRRRVMKELADLRRRFTQDAINLLGEEAYEKYKDIIPEMLGNSKAHAMLKSIKTLGSKRLERGVASSSSRHDVRLFYIHAHLETDTPGTMLYLRKLEQEEELDPEKIDDLSSSELSKQELVKSSLKLLAQYESESIAHVLEEHNLRPTFVNVAEHRVWKYTRLSILPFSFIPARIKTAILCTIWPQAAKWAGVHTDISSHEKQIALDMCKSLGITDSLEGSDAVTVINNALKMYETVKKTSLELFLPSSDFVRSGNSIRQLYSNLTCITHHSVSGQEVGMRLMTSTNTCNDAMELADVLIQYGWLGNEIMISAAKHSVDTPLPQDLTRFLRSSRTLQRAVKMNMMFGTNVPRDLLTVRSSKPHLSVDFDRFNVGHTTVAICKVDSEYRSYELHSDKFLAGNNLAALWTLVQIRHKIRPEDLHCTCSQEGVHVPGPIDFLGCVALSETISVHCRRTSSISAVNPDRICYEFKKNKSVMVYANEEDKMNRLSVDMISSTKICDRRWVQRMCAMMARTSAFGSDLIIESFSPECCSYGVDELRDMINFPCLFTLVRHEQPKRSYDTLYHLLHQVPKNVACLNYNVDQVKWLENHAAQLHRELCAHVSTLESSTKVSLSTTEHLEPQFKRFIYIRRHKFKKIYTDYWLHTLLESIESFNKHQDDIQTDFANLGTDHINIEHDGVTAYDFESDIIVESEEPQIADVPELILQNFTAEELSELERLNSLAETL